MANIISLIEKIGSSAELNKLTSEELTAVINQHLAVSSESTDLVSTLENHLLARTNVVCGIFPAEEPDSEQPEDDSEDEKKDTESRLVVNA